MRSRDGNTPVNCVRVAQSGEPARAPHLSTPSVEPCS